MQNTSFFMQNIYVATRRGRTIRSPSQAIGYE
jgi:hypothetical protein